jgi:hypothetical protein
VKVKIGLRAETKTKRLVVAIDPDEFTWTPGEIESGKSSPGEFFDCHCDEYFIWGWLGVTVTLVRVLF